MNKNTIIMKSQECDMTTTRKSQEFDMTMMRTLRECDMKKKSQKCNMTMAIANTEKVNTKSSSEAELVAVDNSTAQVLLIRHFLAMQGMYMPTMTSTKTTRVQFYLQKTENL